MAEAKSLSHITLQLLKAAVALGLLIYLFSSGKVNVESLKALTSPSVIAVGSLTIGFVLLLASERWRILLTHQQLHARMPFAFRLTLIGTFFNFFVPGGVGGDVMKAVLIANNHPQQRGKAVLTVLADRILGLFTMTFLALVSFSFEPALLTKESSFQIVFVGLLVIFTIFLVAFWVLLSKRAEPFRQRVDHLTAKVPKLQKLWLFAQTYRLTFPQLRALVSFSLAAQILQILLFLVVADQLLPEIPPVSVFLFAVPVGFMVTAVPLAPAGIGIGQAAFFYLFSKAVGHETNIGVIGITAFQGFQLLYGLIGAALFVLLKKENPQISIEKLNAAAEQIEST
jgi:hypothetical protein